MSASDYTSKSFRDDKGDVFYLIYHIKCGAVVADTITHDKTCQANG